MRSPWLLSIVIVVSGIAASWAQAPDAPDTENAILREQVASLKKSLAAKQREVDVLKARLAALEGQIAPTTLEGFFQAVRDNNLAAVRGGLALNAHWLDIERKDLGAVYFPLEQAASRGRREMVEFLLAKGAEVNHKDAQGKVIPLRTDDPEIAALLRKHGATVTKMSDGMDLDKLLKRFEKDLK